MKRFLGPVLTLLLVAGVGAALFFSLREGFQARRVVTVRGLIGSEKEPFFVTKRSCAFLGSTV